LFQKWSLGGTSDQFADSSIFQLANYATTLFSTTNVNNFIDRFSIDTQQVPGSIINFMPKMYCSSVGENSQVDSVNLNFGP
jgi:hypothetical protein